VGVEDRDWYREAQRQREKAERSTAATARWGAFWMLLFWVGLGAVLYTGFSHFESQRSTRQTPYATNAQGEVVITRGRDGHFRLPGTVNGQPVQFLVDTGASLVTVSTTFAQQAGLQGGQRITFNTANGPLPGRVLRDVPVSAGPFTVGGTSVGIGLETGDDALALLGQSFLSRFDIELKGPQMVLRLREQP
jgi:aspartyl protease family protein